MFPILGRYGPFFLHSYFVALGLGLVAGFIVTASLASSDRWPLWHDGALSMMAAAIVGGRLGFVLVNWQFFQGQVVEAWQIWHGGMSYHGALFAGLVGLWAWCRWRQKPFDVYSSLLTPGLTLLNGFGWLACWLEGCAYGKETQLGFMVADLPDALGIGAPRYQVQLLGMLLSLLLFLVAIWRWRHQKRARLFWIVLMANSGGRLLLSLLRGDMSPLLGTLRLDTVLDGAVALISLALIQFRAKDAAVEGEL